MYKTKHYTIQELAHPQIINAIGENNCWMRLDKNVLIDLDYIRGAWFEVTGTGVYINRISHGLDSRGLRPPNDPDGSFYSSHKQGKAFDLDPVNGEFNTFFNFVKELILGGNLKSINTLEDFRFTPTWIHVANMNHNKKLLIIKP